MHQCVRRCVVCPLEGPLAPIRFLVPAGRSERNGPVKVGWLSRRHYPRAGRPACMCDTRRNGLPSL